MYKKYFTLLSLALSPWLCLQLIGEEHAIFETEQPYTSETCGKGPDSLTAENEKSILETEQPYTSETCDKGPNSLTAENEKSLLDTQKPAISETCGKGPSPYYVTMRHIEGEGIGYNQGYTTLEGLFHTTGSDRWVSFLDVRGHLFNNGNPAANVGLGLRQLRSSRIWGINAYYDYRKTPHQHYNQVSVGLESLGSVWDFRINGYLPFGKKKSHLYHLRFDEFQEHYAYISQKYEFSMKGANAEVGAHVNYNNIPLYFAAGPYYLEGQGKVAGGGQARVEIDVWDYIRLEGNTSYDHVFKWIGQGQVSLVIPFGGKKEIRQKRGRSCKQQMTMAKRAVQRVDRMEIIPVDKKRKQSLAIDPATGQPYFFWFVNNTSHSNGTFESPFPTLVQAQNASSINDVIYVYPGDDTTTGMAAGITLKSNQKLFGAGINQILSTTLGTVSIPAMASGLPMISNMGGNSITCGNNNEISGLNIVPTSFNNGIFCNGVTNAYIHNNIFTLNDTLAIGINLANPLGQIKAIDNQINFEAATFITGVLIGSSSPTANYLFANNSFININGIAAASGFDIDGAFTGSITATNNQFTKINQVSMSFDELNSCTLNINSNTFTQSSLENLGDILIAGNAGASVTAHVANNTWINTITPANPSILVANDSGSTICLTLMGNTSDSHPNGYTLQNNNSGTPMSFIADISNNVGHVNEVGTITTGTCP